jgi:hypothetical protein
MKTRIALAVLVATSMMALPAAAEHADERTYTCTALAGAQVQAPNGEAYGVVVTLDERGVGGCNLRVLDSPSHLRAKDAGDRCEITVDINGDQTVDEVAKVGKLYPRGAVFDAFCYVGALVAENSITLH